MEEAINSLPKIFTEVSRLKVRVDRLNARVDKHDELAGRIRQMEIKMEGKELVFLFWQFTSLAADLVTFSSMAVANQNKTFDRLAGRLTKTVQDIKKTLKDGYGFDDKEIGRIYAMGGIRSNECHPFVNDQYFQNGQADRDKIQYVIQKKRDTKLTTSTFLMNGELEIRKSDFNIIFQAIAKRLGFDYEPL